VSFLAISNPGGKIDSITDQGVFKSEVEGVVKFLIGAADEVKESLRPRRWLEWLLSQLLVLLGNFV
jgi:hypothetical protein